MLNNNVGDERHALKQSENVLGFGCSTKLCQQMVSLCLMNWRCICCLARLSAAASRVNSPEEVVGMCISTFYLSCMNREGSVRLHCMVDEYYNKVIVWKSLLCLCLSAVQVS